MQLRMGKGGGGAAEGRVDGMSKFEAWTWTILIFLVLVAIPSSVYRSVLIWLVLVPIAVGVICLIL